MSRSDSTSIPSGFDASGTTAAFASSESTALRAASGSATSITVTFGRFLSRGARSAVVATVVAPPSIHFPICGVKTTARNMTARVMSVETMNDFDMHRTTISRLATIPTVLQKL